MTRKQKRAKATGSFLRRRGIGKKAAKSTLQGAFKLASSVRRGRFEKAPAYKDNPALMIRPGKWIKASAVRVRKVAGRVVMDIKKAI